MPTRRETIEIRAEPEVIFDLVHNYDRRLEWDPFLRKARLLGGASQAGPGVSSLCVAKNGLAMETVYVTYNRPRIAAVKMTRGPAILGAFAASWRQDPLRPGVTEVLYEYHLRGRPRWLGWLLAPILCRVFSHDTRRRLIALKRAVEMADSPLFARLLGFAWAQLNSQLRQAHLDGEQLHLVGTFSIQRGTRKLAQFLAAILRLPRAADAVATQLVVLRTAQGEKWIRRFGNSTMITTQAAGAGGVLRERLGMIELGFRLEVAAGALIYRQVGAAVEFFAMFEVSSREHTTARCS